LKIPKDIIESTIYGNIEFTPIGAPILLKGYERLIREPCGCFEQTSSSTFPMIILMQYLNLQTDPENQDEINKMKFDISKKLKKGMKRLMKFETSDGGFEWFGRSPGHPTLTAYGLWQFLEINKIGDYIDPNVIDRYWFLVLFITDFVFTNLKGHLNG
jgi:uncharacterized protein YfaS (alpha-2-macroglobulin family)